MLEFNAPRIVRLCQILQAISIALTLQPIADRTALIPQGALTKKLFNLGFPIPYAKLLNQNAETARNLLETTNKALGDSLRELSDECSSLGLQFSAREINRAKEKYEANGTLDSADIEVIFTRIIDEFSERKFIQIDQDEAEYYEPKEPLFGKKVATEFPAASYDISEAGKCYGLNRSTACAFHLMRAIETGIWAFAKYLNVTLNYANSWNGHLTKLKPAIEALPSATDADRKRKQQIQEAHAHLNAIRLAWRNDTMHPIEIYTMEEAKNLLQHTKMFMQNLVSILSP